MFLMLFLNMIKWIPLLKAEGCKTVDTLNNDIKGMKIGIAREYLEGVREDVKEAILKGCKVYEVTWCGDCLL